MALHLIDWLIVLLIVLFLWSMAFSAKRYTTSVDGFLSANRSAGRYLLTLAEGGAGLGLISIIAFWEMYYQAGFSALWWGMMLAPLGMVLSMSGWITYRYRQTRVLTMGQFFELRYSKKFRIFGGMLAWLSGIINYGIFPAVAARCLIYFCGIPVYTVTWGIFDINLTMAVVMFLTLATALTFAVLGGQISIMITDFFQSQLVNLVFIAVVVILVSKVGWTGIISTLQQDAHGNAMLNPFNPTRVADFNIWYFLIQGFVVFYGYRIWQGSQGFNCAAKSPHEARMAGILSTWRWQIISITSVMVPVCAYVILRREDFAEVTNSVNAVLGTINGTQMQTQMTVAVTLRHLLPIGMLGLMTAAFIGAAFSTDGAYLHSWGSIFVQDVILPIRNKPLATDQHLKLLRCSIVGVAIFVWCFSMIFPLKEYIFMFFQISGAIYLGGAGSVIIGGLYWKRGTTAGAWAGMIVGSALALSSLLLKNVLWPSLPYLSSTFSGLSFLKNLPKDIPFNGMQLTFFSSMTAILAYIVVSLLTKPAPGFDMDKILHRGKYAVQGDHTVVADTSTWYAKMFGVSSEFTKGDKIIYFASTFLPLLWFTAFVVGSVSYMILKFSNAVWSKWWLFQICVIFTFALSTAIWFIWGGFRDLKTFFAGLKKLKESSGSQASAHVDGDKAKEKLEGSVK